MACTIATSESPNEWALDSSRNVWIVTLLLSQTRSENGLVPVAIIFGYRRGFGNVGRARMEFLVGIVSRRRVSAMLYER